MKTELIAKTTGYLYLKKGSIAEVDLPFGIYTFDKGHKKDVLSDFDEIVFEANYAYVYFNKINTIIPIDIKNILYLSNVLIKEAQNERG